MDFPLFPGHIAYHPIDLANLVHVEDVMANLLAKSDSICWHLILNISHAE